MKRILVTGGAGFIGSALVRQLVLHTDAEMVTVIDKLTYAGSLKNLREVAGKPSFSFKEHDINDAEAVSAIFQELSPDTVFHLAAESHVDRSIDSPAEFIMTNILGTYSLLEQSFRFYKTLPEAEKKCFRFLHISTDEVYGSLGADGLFTENTPYQPHSPYSASKASSDHLVRAWHDTFGLPTLVTNCSNNYGPYQFPEKLIPVVILKALRLEKIPVYGKGENIRDWLYVDDHASALRLVVEKGKPGETYNVGGRNEKTNIDVVRGICSVLDELKPAANGSSYLDLISFVTDRPGHDLRYAIDPAKIESELGWKQSVSFSGGLRLTVQWYLDNLQWVEAVLQGKKEIERLGLGEKK